MAEISEAERKKEKRMKKNEDNLRDFWDNVKRPNIQIIEAQKKTKRKAMRKYFRR